MVDTDFPVNTKKKLLVEIRDEFEEKPYKNTENFLSQLDSTEKSETYIVNAIGRNEAVPLPEYSKVDNDNRISKTNVFFNAPSRCFIYGSDIFETIKYYATIEDEKFIENYNKGKKFVRMNKYQLETIFETIESIVKDSSSENPSIDQIIYLLGQNQPPYPIILEIYKYWQSLDKINGSVIRFQEFPPNHCELRSHAIKNHQTNCRNRVRSDLEYVSRLRTQLEEIRKSRESIILLLNEQNEKQKENIKFIREIMRKIKKKQQNKKKDEILPKITLIQQPELENKIVLPPEEPICVKKSTLPPPPSTPSFLNWCLDQEEQN